MPAAREFIVCVEDSGTFFSGKRKIILSAATVDEMKEEMCNQFQIDGPFSVEYWDEEVRIFVSAYDLADISHTDAPDYTRMRLVADDEQPPPSSKRQKLSAGAGGSAVTHLEAEAVSIDDFATVGAPLMARLNTMFDTKGSKKDAQSLANKVLAKLLRDTLGGGLFEKRGNVGGVGIYQKHVFYGTDAVRKAAKANKYVVSDAAEKTALYLFAEQWTGGTGNPWQKFYAFLNREVWRRQIGIERLNKRLRLTESAAHEAHGAPEGGDAAGAAGAGGADGAEHNNSQGAAGGSSSSSQTRNGYGHRTTVLPAPVNSAGPDQMVVLRAAPIVSVIGTEPEAMELLHDSVHLFEPTATDQGITNIAALGNIKSGKTTTVSTLFALQDYMQHGFTAGAGGHIQNRNTFLASYKVRAKLSASGVTQFGQHTKADLIAMPALNDCNLAEPCAPLLLLGDNTSPFAALPFTDCDGEGINRFFLGLNADPTTLTRLVLDDCDSVAMVQRPAPTAQDPYATVPVVGGAMQHQLFRDCFRGRPHDDKAQVVFCAHFSSDFTDHMTWEDWQIHTWIVAFDKDKPNEADLETVIGKKDVPGTLFHEQVSMRYGLPGCVRFLEFLATEVEKHDALIIFGKAPTAHLNAWPGFALIKHTVTKSRADQIKAKKTAPASFDTLRMLHTVGPSLWDENVHKKARFCHPRVDDDCD